MKPKHVYFAFAAILVAVALSNAQEAVRDVDVDRDVNRTQVNENVTQPANDYQASDHKMRDKMSFKASELIGLNVRGKTGDNDIGEINDLMIHRDGRVTYAAVSFGGFLGIGDKLFAVPMEAIEFVRDEDDIYARIDVSEETLKDKEGFNQDKWPDKPNATFRSHSTHRQVERPVTDEDISR